MFRGVTAVVVSEGLAAEVLVEAVLEGTGSWRMKNV